MVALLRRLANISLVAAMVAVVLTRSDVFIAGQSAALDLAFVVVTMAVSGLCLAVGVIGLVISGARRQWGWFVALLLPLVLVNYGPRLFFIDSKLTYVYTTWGQQAFNLVVVVLMGALPAVVSVLALVYAHALERVPVSAILANDGLELEFTALSRSDRRQHSGSQRSSGRQRETDTTVAEAEQSQNQQEFNR